MKKKNTYTHTHMYKLYVLIDLKYTGPNVSSKLIYNAGKYIYFFIFHQNYIHQSINRITWHLRMTRAQKQKVISV